jgi:FkbM family methyltransferase
MNTRELRALLRLRPEVTSDQYVCGQVTNEYKRLNVPGKTILDLGGNIGAFSVYAAALGAKKIVTYEPDPKNYALLLENCAPYPQIESYEAAIVNSDDKEVSFYLTNGSARDGFSTIAFKGRTEIKVEALNFRAEMDKHKPEIIKMDIEGEEFNLLTAPLPPYVREIVAEIHFSKRRFREEFEQLVSHFANWTALVKPKETGTNFHTLAHWRRT